jgi:S1-C subfamily serine protease
MNDSETCAPPALRRLHPLALTAFILSLLGIPLVGLVTGAVAMILAGVALGQISANPFFRGGKLAVAGMVIGLMDIVMWVILLGLVVPRTNMTAGRQLEQTVFPSAGTLRRAPDHIRAALEANVFFVVERKRWPAFLGDTFSGSGVIIGRNGGDVLILTNRHVVDPAFNPDNPKSPETSLLITTYFHDGTSRPAYVWWIEPNGADLAVIATGSNPVDVAAPEPTKGKDVEIGDKVFAVGNPHDLSWSYTEGVISCIRETGRGPLRLKILQTQTPINQGNSGGGLYAQDGTLIGIVTWTKDKSQAEGISFAIAYDDFIKLFSRVKSSAQENPDAAVTE